MNAKITSLRDQVLTAVAAGSAKAAAIAAAVLGRKPEVKEYDQIWYAIWTLKNEGKLVAGPKRTVSLAQAVAAATPTITPAAPLELPVIPTESLTGEVVSVTTAEELATNALPEESPTAFDENPAEEAAIEAELEVMEEEARRDDAAEEVDPATRVVLVLKGHAQPMARSEIVEQSGLTVSQVKHALAGLKAGGSIKPVGSGFNTKWTI